MKAEEAGFGLCCSSSMPHCSDNCRHVARRMGSMSGRSASVFRCCSMAAAERAASPDSILSAPWREINCNTVEIRNSEATRDVALPAATGRTA